jgi:hypothetical protein
VVREQQGPDGSGSGSGAANNNNTAAGLRFRRSPTEGTAPLQIDLNLLVTFVKYGGEDLLGILSRKHRMLYEVRWPAR